jgi:hypothetical protein
MFRSASRLRGRDCSPCSLLESPGASSVNEGRRQPSLMVSHFELHVITGISLQMRSHLTLTKSGGLIPLSLQTARFVSGSKSPLQNILITHYSLLITYFLIDWVNQQQLADSLTYLGDGYPGIWKIIRQFNCPGERRFYLHVLLKLVHRILRYLLVLKVS